jgi:hypothetical protein
VVDSRQIPRKREGDESLAAEELKREITQLIEAMDRGEAQAAEELLPLVYEELRRLARQKMAAQPPGQTIQATALVHEATWHAENKRSSCKPWKSTAASSALRSSRKPAAATQFCCREFVGCSAASRAWAIFSSRRRWQAGRPQPEG